jgi:hemerythrin-like domain-containing protein
MEVISMRRNDSGSSRRDFLKAGGMTIAAALGAHPLEAAGQKAENTGDLEEGISPVEDLMREHGVLSRALLIYEEILGRIESKKEFPPAVLSGTARLIQRFVESYHEKLEENHVFPRFEKPGKLVDLVKTLVEQHQAGRRLTELILAISSKPLGLEERNRLPVDLRAFCRMYRPHKAREDTILFPAFHGVVSPREFGSLGESFEDEEVRIFGEGGFEKIVDEIAAMEKTLGIFELSQFTPKT